MNITKALSDENRVRILMALRSRELCVCQITAFLDLSPSTTSKHLSVLKQARLIDSKKDGKWVYYRLALSPSSIAAAREAIDWMVRSIAGSDIIKNDDERIQHIIKNEVELFGIEAGKHRDEFHSLEVHSLATDYESSEEPVTGR